MWQPTPNDEKITPFPTFNGCYRSRVYTSEININPLIASSDQLLNLIPVLKSAEYPEDQDKFLQDLQHEIRSFEHHAQLANYPTKTITTARYLICLTLDDAIDSSNWQKKELWQKKNLLSSFYDKTSCANHLAQIIEFTLTNIEDNLHLIELLYLLLNLGLTGKSQNQNSTYSQPELIALTNRLYQIVGQITHLNCKNILVQEEKKSKATYLIILPINKKFLFGGALILSTIITVVIYLTSYIKLNRAEKSFQTTITLTNHS